MRGKIGKVRGKVREVSGEDQGITWEGQVSEGGNKRHEEEVEKVRGNQGSKGEVYEVRRSSRK